MPYVYYNQPPPEKAGFEIASTKIYSSVDKSGEIVRSGGLYYYKKILSDEEKKLKADKKAAKDAEKARVQKALLMYSQQEGSQTQVSQKPSQPHEKTIDELIAEQQEIASKRQKKDLLQKLMKENEAQNAPVEAQKEEIKAEPEASPIDEEQLSKFDTPSVIKTKKYTSTF